MISRWLARWTILGFAATAHADVLDDLGITEKQFALGYSSPLFVPGTDGYKIAGLSISDAHAAGIAAAMADARPGALAMFYECRGDYEKALESTPRVSLDRARLLSRASRPDEARAALAAEEFELLAENAHPEYFFRSTCRPLEDSQDWDGLRAFLKLVGGRFNSPVWRAAIWAEELDLAWHLDELQPLLDATADDTLKLAFFHHRLGNVKESDGFIEQALENATPSRVAETLGLLGESPPVRTAAIKCWNREALSTEERVALFSQLVLAPQGEDFDEMFRTWLSKGGDAVPLSDLIWRRWLSEPVYSARQAALVKALSRRHPDEARFQFLLGRQLMKTDPARAAGIFGKIAALPLTAMPNARAAEWLMDYFSTAIPGSTEDLPFLAIRGLTLLDRQDQILRIIDSHTEWATLPTVDKVRYLAGGRMDQAMVETILGADFSKPENDILSFWLTTALEIRLKTRILPKNTAVAIVAKLDTLVAGSPEKKPDIVNEDASRLIRALAEDDAVATQLSEKLKMLLATISKRNAEQGADLEACIRTAMKPFPRLKDSIPGSETATPDEDLFKGEQAMRWLELVGPPRILRIGPLQAWESYDNQSGKFGGNRDGVALALLIRWSKNLGYLMRGLPALNRPVSPENQAILRNLMRDLGPQNPQRMVLDVLVGSGFVDCGDEALKAQAVAAYDALMSGRKNARGTELFRYVVLETEQAGEDALKSILAEVKRQPHTAREEFIRRAKAWKYPDGITPELIAAELEEPGSPVSDFDKDSVKLIELLRGNPAESTETVELARRIMDRTASLDHNSPKPDIIEQAAAVLEDDDTLDGWLRETHDELRLSGVSEIEILRRLRRLDRRKAEGEMKSRAREYSRQILALDSTDALAAQTLVDDAVKDGDRELLITCIFALGDRAIPTLVRPDVQKVFGDNANMVLSLVRETFSADAALDKDQVGVLHGYFLDAGPRVAAEFRAWLADHPSSLKSSRVIIAGQLVAAGKTDEAVDLIAEKLVIPPEYPGFPFQFPPKPGAEPAKQNVYNDASDLREDLDFMRTQKLFPAVLARMDTLGAPDPFAVATIRMAEDPNSASFDRFGIPILEKLGSFKRSATADSWIRLFQTIPGTAPLLLRLYEERAYEDGHSEPISQQAIYLRVAAKQPGSAPLIARMWKKIFTAAGALEDSAKKEQATLQMAGLLRDMLVSADDATWRDYWAWRENEATPLGNLSFMDKGGPPTGFVETARLRQIQPRLLGEAVKPLPSRTSMGFALLAVAAGDPEQLEKTRAAMPPKNIGTRFCDLGLGNAERIVPNFHADPEQNGETMLSWNLVSTFPNEDKMVFIPRAPFPALDGKLDLEFSAGVDPDHLKIVKKLPAAPATGHVQLKLATDQRYVAMTASDPATGKIHKLPLRDLEYGVSPTLSLSDEDLTNRGFVKLPDNGPGDMPAWKIRFSGRDSVDLLEIPWNDKEALALDVWVAGYGQLTLLGFDAADNLTTNLKVYPYSALNPLWRFCWMRLGEGYPLPKETVRLVLSATVRNAQDVAPDFAFSNLRIEVGKPVAVPPDR